MVASLLLAMGMGGSDSLLGLLAVRWLQEWQMAPAALDILGEGAWRYGWKLLHEDPKKRAPPAARAPRMTLAGAVRQAAKKMLPHEILLPWFPVLDNQIAFMRNILAF